MDGLLSHHKATQEELATWAGFSAGHLSQIKCGKVRVGGKVSRIISKKTGLPVDYFFNLPGDDFVELLELAHYHRFETAAERKRILDRQKQEQLRKERKAAEELTTQPVQADILQIILGGGKLGPTETKEQERLLMIEVALSASKLAKECLQRAAILGQQQHA